MALAGWIMLARPVWRMAWAWPVAVIDLVLAGVGFLASSTGQGLSRAVGDPGEHAEYGSVAPWFFVAMAVGAIAFALVRRRGRVPVIAGGALLVLTSVVAVVWVVITGHTGSAAAWQGVTLG